MRDWCRQRTSSCHTSTQIRSMLTSPYVWEVRTGATLQWVKPSCSTTYEGLLQAPVLAAALIVQLPPGHAISVNGCNHNRLRA